MEHANLRRWWAGECARLLATRQRTSAPDIGCPSPPDAGSMWNATPLALWPFAGALRYRRRAGGWPSSGCDEVLWAAAGTWKHRRARARARLAKIEWHPDRTVLVRNDRGAKALLHLPGGDLHARVSAASAAADADRPIRLHALLDLALLDIHARCRHAPAPDPARERFERACDYIREHLAEDCDRRTVARAVDCHPGHLSRLFRHHADRGFNAWVRRERLRAAAALVDRSDLDLAAIAARCGFGDASYLIRCYRAYHGHTPRRLRAR